MLEKLPYKNLDLKTDKILKQLTATSRILAELKGYAKTLPNTNILLNAITIKEAKDSSEIENIVTTEDEIYKALSESGYKEENAKEVVNYRKAIWEGYKIVKEKGYINTNAIIKVQEIIENSKTGIRKLPGTKLTNSKTGKTIYTPPQDEKEIRDLLKNLEDFINDNNDNIDPLIKLALIHYQFESIHPFYDGNGRTGRIINILYLILTGLLDTPILYLSRFINNTKDEYYKLFNKTRETNNYEDWIIYILKGIEIASFETIKQIMDINYEIEDYKKDFKELLPKIYDDRIVENLFYEVYTRISYIEKACSVTRLTAMSYLRQLEDAGLLISEKIGRERIYKNYRLIEVLSDKEMELRG